MRCRVKSFRRSTDGTVMVEFTLIVSLLLVVTLGMVDFSFALMQWNQAAKATQLGARIAATSDAVSSDINNIVVTSNATDYAERVCSGATATCSNGGTYDAQAMRNIVFGRGKSACSAVAAGQLPAMCDVFIGADGVPGLRVIDVKVTYTLLPIATSGLGYVKRQGGPVPTITVEITNRTFNFFFLNGLLGFPPIAMPTMRTTITGEDLSSSGN